MPRLRPLKKEEDIAAVPLDQPVRIELEPEGTVEVPPETEEQVLQPDTKPEAAPAPAPRKQDRSEADYVALEKQLEDLRKAEAIQKERAVLFERQHQEAMRLAETREKELTAAGGRADQAEYDAVMNAIGAVQAEAETANRDLAMAVQQADAAAIADANRRMARAETRLVQLEDGKAALESRHAASKNQRTEPERQDIQSQIDRMPNLLPQERDWLKSHSEVLVDPRRNARIQAYHMDAEDAGIRRGSEDYFKFIEEKLGYRKVEQPVTTTLNQDDDDEPVVAAPVSRETPSPSSGRPQNNRITLTPEQREMARMSGISEIEYARQLIRLNDLKRNGHYNER